jgi:hypothetical protein
MAKRRDYLDMIRAFPGGWDAMAGACGMSRQSLENRIYERKGQTVSVELAELMQSFACTTHFAEGVARDAGGVFMKLPEVGDVGNEELLSEFNKLYAELGQMSGKFRAYVADDLISDTERADLNAEAQEIHRTLEQLLALTYRVYCKPEGAA